MYNSRTRNSIFNFFANMGGQILSIIFKFVSRTIFIYILGKSYLGINGLFTNILSVLSLAELGIGSAVVFNMYKPIADNDYKKLSALIGYYRSLYRKIALFVFVAGILLIPFLQFIVNLSDDIEYLYMIYILYLLNTSVSYLYVYKTTILYADQKEYKIKIYSCIFELLNMIAQSSILLITKNYLLYICVQIFFSIITNIFIGHKAEKEYPMVYNLNEKLSKFEKKKIWSDIKAMFSYKVGAIIMNNTDQILISILVNTMMVGVYSNYLMIISSVSALTSSVFLSIKASIGNLATENNRKKEYEIFNILNLIAFWLYGFCTICFIILFNNFIIIWIGEGYLLDIATVFVIAFSFYISGILYPVFCFRETVGLFKETKNILYYSSIVNLILSIILGKLFGLTGILTATVLARIVTNLWYEPYKLFTIYFKKRFKSYLKKQLIYYILLVIAIVIVSVLSYVLSTIVTNQIILLFLRFLLCLIIPNLIFLSFIKQTKEYSLAKYYLNHQVKNIINKE